MLGAAAALLCAPLLAACSGGGADGGDRLPRAETARLTAIADAYLQRRADAVTAVARDTGPLPPPAHLTPAFARRTAHDLGKLAESGRQLQRVDGGYGRAQVDTVARAATRRGDTVTLEVMEDTDLLPPADQADAPTEEYALSHTLTFERTDSGGWLLAGDRPETGAGMPPATQVRAASG
ncbi:hypothetical protein STRAU_6309 [Streptomyces aurantiacus JA 4570]|uniref:Uncharacterized protein n=1 Tax=Streptomyces aurantiacus JA 4570 TaxID=1286094 RepID=S4AGK4_9ACTN|nr:hypothetical protein STRAU_6309 [Streptomyces aurantiacus JA 4570]